MNTNSIRIKTIHYGIKQLIILLFVSFFSIFCSINQVYANNSDFTLQTNKLKEYSNNSIYFYRPCENRNKNFSSICGNTAREKYWSALINAGFKDYQVAGMFGSIDHEGGFGPTLYQWKNIVDKDTKQFVQGVTWDTLYNCPKGKCPGGVGSFQITYELGWYLQQINTESPDLIKYFKDPLNYQLSGDEILKKIGATDFDRLVEQEIKHFVLGSRKASSDGLKATQTLEEATDYWTKIVENCADCCGEADKDKSCGQIEPRRASAKKELDDMSTFTCNSSSSSSSSSVSANTSQYTLLEGYGSITFYGPDAASNGGFAGRNATESINGARLADGQVAKDTRDGGVLQFGDIVYIETTPEPNAESSHANGKFFIVADTGAETANTAKWNIDVFVNEPTPSKLFNPPYGSTTNVKIYKVASGVSWEEYLEKYHGKTNVNIESDNSCDDPTGATGNIIADTALKLSWDCGSSSGCHSQGNPPYEPKPEYLKAMESLAPKDEEPYDNPKWGYGASCDRFVAIVMRYSGADPNFPTGYANDSGAYMLDNPELYEKIDFNGSNYEVLKPGDIFSTFAPRNTGHGHIWIYVTINGEHGRADASHGEHSGRTAEHYTRTPIINDGREYKVFRRK